MTSPPETLVDLFSRSVVDHADRAAVSDDHRSLTYAELDRRSAAVAAVLLARGIQPDDSVGLYVERSVEVVVAILGILRAGAAYVAVDSRYPAARRDLMLRSSGAKAVITQPDWCERLAGTELDLITLDNLDECVAASVGLVDPTSAATVLFTSGSSGVPKAIVLEHRNVVSFATNPGLPRPQPGERTGQISSISFDAFHFELWTTLSAGGEVVVLPPVADLLAADFGRELKRRRINAMLVPTMVVSHVVREDRDAFASLRILQAGGDVLLPSTCRDVLTEAFTGVLWNLYGPAEITTACTAHRVTEADATGDTIPIGRALNGVSTLVLRPDQTPASPGEVGELHVGGAGVGRGYLGDSDLTAARFIDLDGHGRVYRTGDLVRDRGDGVLEFVGRADDQVKIRGYRVEVGEVERTLRRHPDVHDVAVLPAGAAGDRNLVAFVVLDGALEIAGLRQFARSELPDYMVPSHFIALPEIPASAHGKRDMDVLRVTLDEHERRRADHVAPETETERYLAGVWERLLAADNVGRFDDFYALGGHSLMVFRLRSRIKRDRGTTVEHNLLLQSSVLSEMAAAIDRVHGGEL
ncbi:hypothetical protein GCM10011609_86730 [Lentzea pudingi]|uniref:Carrier domain-containing protein n=1 Tax=Lentzea pudingi TaxID=1789439 RepID=A0ABQ2IWJ6_9PSEU|nr:non-ribosomal peptide synthetase [Lentzea pudingi]GGN29525.1 hypothetical protein GCM10011609_86730 [Lentzea pudingi]